MSRRHRARTILFALIAVLASGCAQEFTRDDAVASLRAGGADVVTSTCVADTLAVLDALDAADPAQTASAASRTALLRARERCAPSTTTDSAPGVDVAGVRVERPAAAVTTEPSALTSAVQSHDGGPSESAATTEAVQRLVALGRDATNARCVVEHLELLSAEYVFDSPTFGLGATPEEASAFAFCS